MKSLRGNTHYLEDMAEETVREDQPSPEEQAQVRDERRWVRQGMQGLSREHRAVLELVFYQELSLNEIEQVECSFHFPSLLLHPGRRDHRLAKIEYSNDSVLGGGGQARPALHLLELLPANTPEGHAGEQHAPQRRCDDGGHCGQRLAG